MPIKITDDNYQLYKSVFTVICNHYWSLLPPMPEDIHPVNLLSSSELKSMARAKQGLRITLNEMITELNEFPPELIKKIDTDLKNQNLPDIKALLAEVKNTVAAVLKRKKIKNHVEFYMIKELVIDQASDLSEEDRTKLDKYLVEFEFGK